MSDNGNHKAPDQASLPRGWARSRLGDLGHYLNGRGFKKSEWGTTGRPIIRIQDLTGTSANPNYFDGDVEERHIARNGDFLISWAATLGAYIYRGPEGLVNQHIFKVETFINQAFHFYAVTHAIEDMYRRTRGTGMVHIVKADFDNTEIPLPPLAEQSRIVDRIDELFTDLAAGVAALERVKRNLSRYRAAVLHAAVTGRLTEAWRKEHGPPDEPAPELLERILVERRKQWERRILAAYEAKGKQPPKNWKSRYKEPLPPEVKAGQSLPNDWVHASVDQVSFVGSGTTPKRGENRYWQEGTVPWVTSAVVNLDFVDQPSELVTEAALEETTLRIYPPGTLLMALYGEGKTRGMVTELRIPTTINQALAAMTWFPGSDACKDYVKIVLDEMYQQLRREAAGGVQPNLNAELVRKIAIPLPSLSEQSVIVISVNEKLSQIDALEAEVTRGLARAGRLRQAILKSAFEGKLVTQDPNDEPASALLERIRQQAAEAPKPKRKTKKKTTRKAATL